MQLSIYTEAAGRNGKQIVHEVADAEAWLAAQSFADDELADIREALSERRFYHGGGGAALAWAVKPAEPDDEKLDPWSADVPPHATAESAPAKARFVMQAEFMVPHYVRYVVDAESEAHAVVAIGKMEDERANFWEGQKEDFDSSGATSFSNVTEEYADGALSAFEDGEQV